MNVVLPTLAVVLTWLIVAALLGGIGVLVARGLTALAGAPGRLRVSTALWLGLAAVVVYLLLWNLVLPIDWSSWPAPIACGVIGLALAARRARRPPRPPLRGLLLAAGLALVALWFANRALGPATDYDLGLYHLNVIGYAEHYATVPGLGNLHSRLGAGDAQLLLAALLDHGPWAGAAFHLLDGLFATILLIELGSRLARPAPASFTRRVAALLLPATVVLVAMDPDYRLASPNLDLATFVLVAAALLYLADCLEHGVRALEACTAIGLLALASATRPLYWVTSLLALAVLAFAVRGAGRRRLLRGATAVCALPILLALGWMARQAILSGYPFYPLTLGVLPVDWRIPVSVIVSQNQGDDAWARWPDMAPSYVLSNWQWLHASWLPAEEKDLAVIAPLTLLGGVVPGIVAGLGTGWRRRGRPLLALLACSLPTLGAWFWIAPDPRFAWAPIWLVPIALAAWALPPLTRAALAALAAGVAVGVVVTVLLVHHLVWLPPALLALWAYLALMALVLRRRRWGALLAHAAVVSAVVVSLGVLVDRNAFGLVHANQPGPFGTPLEATPPTTEVQTDSGLRLAQTADGGDQCFALLMCTPLLINDHLHLRGSGIASGFSVGA